MSTRLRYALPSLFVAAIMMIGLTGCDWDDSGASLFDPNFTAERPDPTITSISPNNWAFGGVGPVVITGTGFSSDPAQNVVLFNEERGQVLEASPERIVVRPPQIFGDLNLRVTTLGALGYASGELNLRRAIEPFGGLTSVEAPRGIGVDGAGNVYAALFGASPAGIAKFTPDGERTAHVPPQSWTYIDIAGASDGTLYLARGITPLIYRVPPEGGPPTVFRNVGAGRQVNTVTIDQYGNVWAGGGLPDVYRVTQDNQLEVFPFTGVVRVIRAHGDYIYVAATRDNVNGIFRAPLDAAGNIGAFQPFFDFGGTYNTQAPIRAMDIAADGTIYAGGDFAESIVMVRPDGSSSPLYPGLNQMRPMVIGMAYSPEGFLYVSRVTTETASLTPGSPPNTILRVDLRPQGD
jgi:hypothetical protein